MTTTKPTPLPHAHLRIEWAAIVAVSHDADGYWVCEYRPRRSGSAWSAVLRPQWDAAFEYRIVKGPNHPDNQKPKLRLIDKSKLPRGTMTKHGELLRHTQDGFVYYWFVDGTDGVNWRSYNYLRLAAQERWTAWTGGDCPMPEGIRVAALNRKFDVVKVGDAEDFSWRHVGSLDDLIAYRIIGLASGWTDDEEAVQ